MLISLAIRNVVLIDKLDLEFAAGLTILSGETGAGKSILLDSLGLLLGNRADVSLIRTAEDRLTVTGVFSLPAQSSAFWREIKENELEIQDEVVIRRVLNRDGRGKIFINDQPITLKLLKELGSYLVEIHGQFDNQGLLDTAKHLDILDRYGGYTKNLEETKEAYCRYTKAYQEFKTAEEQHFAALKDEDNIRHWADELRKLKPVAGEEDELNARRLEIMNSEKLIESLNFAYGSLTQSADVISLIRHAQSAVDRANSVVGGKYQDIADILEQTLINAEEAVRQIEDASSLLSYNQNEAENIEQRLFALRALARKHGTDINSLPQKLEEFEKLLQSFSTSDENISRLHGVSEKYRLEYLEKAKILSDLRHKAAAKLDKAVAQELPALKMEKAKFVTEIKTLPDTSFGAKGGDYVCFSVATNPNSPQGPLNKIASGGELARFMLALKVNLKSENDNMTMIFDEVDSGIGGATAQAVGNRLKRLSSSAQVLIVTHSPQVAACGDEHFKVEKKTINDITTTYVRRLSLEERKEEIARMLSGSVITDEARAAADVLIKAKG
ncbi:MAG: DNA repair protein RecN [Alphaproteobacteria bacterium]|nr:DNA repair protein RecN [Alphaproteobacteria bacterium]